MSDFYSKHADKFKFGWEVEMMITDKNFTPLFGDALPFEKLRDIICAVEADDIPYLKEKYAGSGLRPYYIEGYDASYDKDTVGSVTVKGIEIRTPIAFSIEESVAMFEGYYNRMQAALRAHGMNMACFGNHPFQPAFRGERGRRDVIGWASAEVAMTTHGLVINESLPDAMEARLDRGALNCRFSHAAPVMILFAANTPFRKGEPWKPEGKQAFSDRSYRRSFVRDTVYYRDDQNHRKEVTLFDMTNDLSMYGAYAALSLGIILGDEEVPVIPDRFSKENVRRAALHGYDAVFIDRHFDTFAPETAARRVLEMCDRALVKHGFDAGLLAPLWTLLERRAVPAQDTIKAYAEKGSIEAVLESRAELIRSHAPEKAMAKAG